MAKLGKTLLVIIVGIVLNAELVNAELRCPLDNRNDNLATQFGIRGTSIQIPVGAFLLVRKNGEVGAIRLRTLIRPSQRIMGNLPTNHIFQAMLRVCSAQESSYGTRANAM